MSGFDYTDVKLGARIDEANGVLVVAALVDGVEIPVGVHKLGHYSDQLAEAAAARSAAAPTPGESTAA